MMTDVRMNTTTITLSKVTKQFTHEQSMHTILHDVDAHFVHNHSYAITGMSGTGKSTLMHLIAGIDTPDSGTVACNNIPLSEMTESERTHYLNQTIGLVFQTPHLLSELSVVENVMLPQLLTNQPYQKIYQKARDLLAYVGLTDNITSHPKALSGGQQQRVVIARALINNPAFLIADEPTGNLDEQTGYTIIELLTRCRKEWGMGIIISSHDTYVTQQMHTIYELKDTKLHTLSY